MTQRIGGRVAEAQRDVARHPFEIGVIRPVGEPVLRGHGIGRVGFSGAHQLPREAAAAGRPGPGFAERLGVFRSFQQQLQRVRVAALAGAPGKALVGHAGIVGQRVGHRGDAGVDAAVVVLQRQTRLGQLAFAVADEREHGASIDGPALPKRHVQPRPVMRRQQITVFREERGLFLRRQRQRAPGQHHLGLGRAAVARSDQGACQAQRAGAGLRPGVGKEGAHIRMAGLDDRLFGFLAQVLHARPVRIALDEILDLFGVAQPGAQIVPGDDVHRDLPVRPRRDLCSGPVALPHVGHRPLQRARSSLRGDGAGTQDQDQGQYA